MVAEYWRTGLGLQAVDESEGQCYAETTMATTVSTCEEEEEEDDYDVRGNRDDDVDVAW